MKNNRLSLFAFVVIGLFIFNFNLIGANTVSAYDCVISNTLGIGSTGDEVSCLQMRLGVAVDGKFGPRTQMAVASFQNALGLSADGVFGAGSRAIFAPTQTSLSIQVPSYSSTSASNRTATSISTSNSTSNSTSTNTKTKKQPTSVITLLHPVGGEIWYKGETKTIAWHDTVSYSSYKLELVPYYPPCTSRICPSRAEHAPYLIMANVSGNTYDWVVGRERNADVFGIVPDGFYTIRVCQTGTSNCGSNEYPLSILDTKGGAGSSYPADITSSNQTVSIFPAGSTTDHNGGVIASAFTVTSNAKWTVSSNQSWVKLNKTSGTGNSTVGFSYLANTAVLSRTAFVTVTAGTRSVVYTFTQGGAIVTAVPTVTIFANPKSVNSGEASTISWFSTNATSCVGSGGTNGWAGTKTLSGSFPTGALVNTTTYSITCMNNLDDERQSVTASLAIEVISNQTVSIFPAGSTTDHNGGVIASAFTVTSNAKWTVSSNQSWVKLNKTSGTGNSTVGFSYLANTANEDMASLTRTALITVTAGTKTAVYTFVQLGTSK
ncbi:MAG: BACON domain-containing carbohydrate-binding protein [Candidatus Paceibacterota bacterium]|jgi:hypothetical protein